MDWDFSKHQALGHMNKKRRWFLFDWLQTHSTDTSRIILIGGKAPRSAQIDWEAVTLLFIEYAGHGKVYVLTSKPSRETPEFFAVGQMYFDELDELMHGENVMYGTNPHAYKKRKESPGRPPKYGTKEATMVQALKKEGHSIRKIAAKMNMSTYTVQKLLRRVEK